MFTLALETQPGAQIGYAAESAIKIANMLDVHVTFTFNELHLVVRPGDDVETVLRQYDRALAYRYSQREQEEAQA